jgi:hypothetical protein
MINRSDVLVFVETLDPEYQEVFHWAEEEAHNPDTLSNEFQVASAIVDSFWKHVEILHGLA